MEAKVLLVDDEVDFTNVLEERLNMRGLQVDTAANGTDGLELAKSNYYDAIVLDLAMPGMDGIETLKRLMKRNADLQVILLTGKATVRQSVEAMKEGAVEFLEKPVNIDHLLDLLQNAQARRLEINEEKADLLMKDIMKSKGW